MSHTETAADPIELFKKAFCEDDAPAVANLFKSHPEMKVRIDDPLASFDSPVITQTRSRGMLDVLLEAGADINAKSRWWAGGFGILDGADPELASYAIKRGAIVHIHAASRLGLTDTLRELIAGNPALVHARGGDGQTPLHFASTIEISDYLLDHGADINVRDVDHESTPAQYMVRERQDIARHLVRRGCQTDILLAAALGDMALVRRHLDTDPATIRTSVSERYFPKKNPRSGGTIYIWTLGQYKTAHGIAHEFGHQEIYQLLMDRSPEELRFAVACELGDEPAVKAMLAGRPNLIETLSEDARQKLAYAALNNNIEAVRLMLAVGWPAGVRGQHGGTPLHWAAFHGNATMAEVILRHNPPLEWTDTDFHGTPLGWAIHGSEQGWHHRTGNYAATIEALLSAGAKLPGKIGGSEPVRAILRRFGLKEG